MTSTAPASATGCYSLRFPLSDYVSTWLLIPGSNPSEHVVALLHNVQVSHYWLVLLLLASRELLVYMKKRVSEIEHSRYV